MRCDLPLVQKANKKKSSIPVCVCPSNIQVTVLKLKLFNLTDTWEFDYAASLHLLKMRRKWNRKQLNLIFAVCTAIISELGFRGIL